MKKYRWIIVLVNLITLLVFFNVSMIKKESLLSNGKLVLMELAPVDPRSLMQGDYMALRYNLSQNMNLNNISKRGYCVIGLQPNGVALPLRFQNEKSPRAVGEYLIRFTYAEWQIKIGAESFFFQEGESEKYAIAKYGGLKVDDDGNSLLIGLFDGKLKRIE